MELWASLGGEVAEENESVEAGTHVSGAPDTAGHDLAMEEARNDPSLPGDVAAFLRNQNPLIEIQTHHLQARFARQMRQLRVWEKRLGVLLPLCA